MAVDDRGARGRPIYTGAGAPADAEDLTYLGELVTTLGTRRVGTTDERKALEAIWKFPGLEWHDTTDGNTYLWSDANGGDWLPRLGDTGWITPAPLAGTSPNAQYIRTNGWVGLDGSWVPTADSQAMFRLDVGCRPNNTGTWWCERGGTDGPKAKVEIQASTGYVIFRQSGGSGPINFAPIVFRAAR